MTPAAFPLNIYRGDSYRWQFRFWSDAAKTQPTDLTGVMPKAEIRERPGGASITALGCTVTLPNIVDVVLDAAPSQLLPLKGAWDLQFTYAANDVRTVVAGDMTLTQDVTDSTPAGASLLRRTGAL